MLINSQRPDLFKNGQTGKSETGIQIRATNARSRFFAATIRVPSRRTHRVLHCVVFDVHRRTPYGVVIMSDDFQRLKH